MLQPLGTRLLIEEIKEDERKGLLIVKNDDIKKYKVISIGDEVTKINLNDIVVIVPYAHQALKLDEKNYLIIEQDSILAKVA